MRNSVRVVDSHTGGEPTRVVLEGLPDLGLGSLAERRERLRSQYDRYRQAILREPRGSDVLVGAFLMPPVDPRCAAGVVFCNAFGYLNMCGHATIGVGVTLGDRGLISAGRHLLETPVGVVPFDFDGRNTVALENVPSYRAKKGVRLTTPSFGTLSGDVVWGGNWFFLCADHGIPLTATRIDGLSKCAREIASALESSHPEVDHIELTGPALDPKNSGRNFVLCPGGAYDRSPCGTGTSAKLACLYADGHLKPGEIWRQEGILGTAFEGWVRVEGEAVYPSVRGQAFITGEALLRFDENDPFRDGIPIQ